MHAGKNNLNHVYIIWIWNQLLDAGKGIWHWHYWPFTEVISALAAAAEATKNVIKMSEWHRQEGYGEQSRVSPCIKPPCIPIVRCSGLYIQKRDYGVREGAEKDKLNDQGERARAKNPETLQQRKKEGEEGCGSGL